MTQRKDVPKNSIPSSQSRHEVCSQGQVEKGSLGGNGLDTATSLGERKPWSQTSCILVKNWYYHILPNARGIVWVCVCVYIYIHTHSINLT